MLVHWGKTLEAPLSKVNFICFVGLHKGRVNKRFFERAKSLIFSER